MPIQQLRFFQSTKGNERNRNATYVNNFCSALQCSNNLLNNMKRYKIGFHECFLRTGIVLVINYDDY